MRNQKEVSMRTPRRWYLVGLAVLGWACAAPESAKAAFVLNSRTSTYGITFSDDTFAGANVDYKIQQNYSSNNGDSLFYNFSIKTLGQNISVVGGGNVAVTNLNI